MQSNLPGAVLLLLWPFIGIAVIGGYIVMMVALWRSMKAHESIAQAVSDIARHLDGPGTTKHDADRFTFGE
jgi:hypothetical protein